MITVDSISRELRFSSQSGVHSGVIDHLPQFLAGLEMGNILGIQCNSDPGFGISSDSGRSEAERKTAESPDLNSTPVGEGFSHIIQQALDREFNMTICQMDIFVRQQLDNI